MMAIAGGFVLGNVTGSGVSSTYALVIDHFPAQVGNSWEYKRTFYIIVYDTVHNDTTEYLLVDSLHEEFEDIDTMADWECYRLRHILFEQGDTFPETWWYAHPDTALLWIAYLGGGKKSKISVEPKSNIKLRLGEMYFDSPQGLANYLYSLRYTRILPLRADTMYRSPPKKLLVFPLEVGKFWIAMTDPWLEEREVVAEDSVTVPAGDFFALKTKITSDWMEEWDLWYKWITNEGIVKDSSHVRGEAIDETGVIIGYWDSDDIYELLDFQIGVEENVSYQSQTIELFQSCPNPFYFETIIRYAVAKPTQVMLKVYDVTGQFVKMLVNRKQQPGFYTICWDKRDNHGQETMSGVYFCRLEAEDFVSIKKLVILH